MRFVVDLLQLYVFVLIAYSLLSWIRPSYGSPILTVQRGLAKVCDPVLKPARRLIPSAQIGGVGLDLSVLIVIVVIEVVLIPLIGG